MLQESYAGGSYLRHFHERLHDAVPDYCHLSRGAVFGEVYAREVSVEKCLHFFRLALYEEKSGNGGSLFTADTFLLTVVNDVGVYERWETSAKRVVHLFHLRMT